MQMKPWIASAIIASIPAVALAQQTSTPTAIPIQSLAPAVAAAIKQNAFAGVNVGSATAGGTPLSTIATQAAGAVPAVNLGTTAFAATGGVAARTSADRAADRLNVREYRLASDPDDTAAVNRLWLAAQTMLDMGQSVAIDFPGVLHVTSMPQFQVPRGVDLTLNSAPYGGTEIIVNGASNGIDIASVVPTAAEQPLMPATSSLSRFAVGDFKITKGLSAPAGYDAVRVAGLPNSMGSALYGATVGRVTAGGQGFGGNSTNPWLNVVHLLDQNYFHVRGCVNIYTGPANGEMASGTCLLVETTQSSVNNFSDDSYIDEITQNGGFAGAQTKGHVEGVHLSDMTVVGAVYGVYSPAYIEIPASGNTPAFVNGVDGLYVTQSHMNTVLRGVYAENAANVQLDATDYIYSLGSTPSTPLASDAVLPADTAALNPSNALGGYSYVGVDGVNTSNLIVVGTNFEGSGAGFSNAVRDDVASVLGQPTPTGIQGVSISGITADRFRGFQIHVGSAVSFGNVDGNNATNTTTGYELLSTTIEHSNNVYAGYVYDTAFMNGVETINGALNAQSATLPILNVPGSMELGTQGSASGTTGFIDTHSAPAAPAGTAPNDYDVRLYGVGGTAGTTGQGSLHLRGTGGLVLENGGIQSAGIILDQSGTHAYVSATGGSFAAVGRRVMIQCAHPTDTYAALTVTLPQATADQQPFSLSASCPISKVTLTPASGQTTYLASAPLAPGQMINLIYDQNTGSLAAPGWE